MKRKANLLFVLMLGFLLTHCNVNTQAQTNADFIMNNLDSKEIVHQFPKKYFPAEQIKPLLDTLNSKCDLPNKRGKFVDFFTMDTNGKFQTAYIYEYFLDCDSLRFIYLYDFSQKDPELMGFRIEEIEQPNQMIIHPEKGL